jgi:hypothetical protein
MDASTTARAVRSRLLASGRPLERGESPYDTIRNGLESTPEGASAAKGKSPMAPFLSGTGVCKRHQIPPCLPSRNARDEC